ncbi:MAG: nitrogen regulation protein NR(I) [Candidatus Thiodiazotropha sp. (ex Lucinoma aequizonata)]|nr:nitrogen regulation protein NR(I) [Candidatus Thiodiazotropha sp. (ex Lucinoma aequizonata)]MCU7889589.1 nitrogen regulation protein NR(I) [Candidatus Thiodiazotropha sp. (ex Lucinoma aequizonata)]MCU7895893.1 nitrogen regulation protein NR(I) [Candidatus Thiodiazotropha sp. (ex Lucinoma aequizonata)]MCU7897520.1 nitrogen regulation protein NR(I) [Candidatus Thiodiazotropha sp. (ex Lucinoma aequizonata)]MCU7900881.1 nitrogen regulation protein NR(I) [Candidatus Thiodiazotropha sp. (ex Lucino
MDRTCRVWVIDDDRSIRWVLKKTLEKADMDVISFESADHVLSYLDKEQPDVVVSDIRMPGMDGLELLELLHARFPGLPVIIMTAHSDLESAVSAYHGGAFDYLPKPFDVDDAVQQIRHACRQQITVDEKPAINAREKENEIIGEAPAMQEVFRAIGRLARSNITVLINGESGTGKELVAQALHRHSSRAAGPFIALNMAAIPRDLMESELFGHERGAFTGAQTRRVGRFEQADSGTLFLDEIGDMLAELQTRLLRVLADGEFYRVGGHEPVKVDVRIIAATHQHLDGLVKSGSFREDLFHRLNVIRIHIPALRQRREDIPVLMKHFLNSTAEELAVESKLLLPETVAYLSQMEWPGNVRQLENTARWLTVMASGQEIHIDDLPTELRDSETPPTFQDDWRQLLRGWAKKRLQEGCEGLLNEAGPDFETVMIETALEHTSGRRQDAARLLGWGRNTLTRKIKDLGIEKS